VRNWFYLPVLLLAIFCNFYKIDQRFNFDWDQERDASIVYFGLIKDKNLPFIGPRVVDETGFFLGPLHYYLSSPFYFLFRGDPLGGAFWGALIGVLTSITYTFVATKLFNWKAGLALGILTASLPNTTAWNAMYMFLLSLLTYLMCIAILLGRTKFIPIVFFLVAAGLQSHFSGIFLLIMVGICVSMSWNHIHNNQKGLVRLGIGLIILLVSFLPLLLFDLKNNFNNLRWFLGFFLKQKAVNVFLPDQFFNTLFQIFNPFNDVLNSWLLAVVIPIILLVYMKISLIPRVLKTFTAIWIVLPLVFVVAYSFKSPLYYYSTIIPIISILIVGIIFSFISSKKVFLVGALILVVSVLRIYKVAHFKSSKSISVKKAVVEYILAGPDPIFNVSYSVPLGENTGFDYLFKWYGRLPYNGPEGHLWTIVMPPNRENISPLATFGFYGVVRR
jgi:4-amino-4-deoxy-L-arabinose transferase-like glycosyltransferase